MNKYCFFSRKQGWVSNDIKSMRVYTSEIFEGLYDNLCDNTGKEICLAIENIDKHKELYEIAKDNKNWYLYRYNTNIGQYTLI